MLAIGGILLATVMYATGKSRITRVVNVVMHEPIKAAYHRFYLDEVWLFITKKVIFNCISRPIAWFDRNVVDASLDLMARAAQRLGTLVRPLQSGNIQTDCIYFLSGALAIMLVLLYIY